MILSDDELLVDFRQAKNKRLQVSILADQCCCSAYEVAKRLEKLGAFRGTLLQAKQFSNRYQPTEGVGENWKGFKRHIEPLDEERCRELYDKGLSDVDIALAMDVKAYRIEAWRRKEGLRRPHPKKLEKEERERMKKENAAAAAAVLPAAAPTCCQPGKPVDVWKETSPSAARADAGEAVTVAGFLELLKTYLPPALGDAELTVDGRPVTGLFGYRVRVAGDRKTVELCLEDVGCTSS